MRTILGFSKRINDNLSFKNINSLKEEVQVTKRRKKFLKKLGINLNNIIAMEGVHSKKVYLVTSKDKGRGAFSKKDWIFGVDGLLTGEPNLYLLGTFADCLPIYFWDPIKKVVGLAHAGWRSVVKNIAGEMTKKMIKNFGSSPQDISIYIGPSIGPCCFEVKDEVLKKFRKMPESLILKKKNKFFIDLQKTCFNQLKKLGLLTKNLKKTNICTCCQKEYFSYRREGKTSGMIAVVGFI